MGPLMAQDDDGPVLKLANGSVSCGGLPAELQVFVYRAGENDTYTQTKLDDPASYIMRDESVVPDGDCVIVEFDQLKESTDKLCLQYGIRDSVRCEAFGVTPYNPDLCKLKLVTAGGSE